jgi:hypothetical protein
MATSSNGNGGGLPKPGVYLTPLQFFLAMAAVIAITTGVGVKYNALCAQVSSVATELDARTARRDEQYKALTASIEELTATVQDMRDGMIAAGLLKPNAMRPMGHPQTTSP